MLLTCARMPCAGIYHARSAGPEIPVPGDTIADDPVGLKPSAGATVARLASSVLLPLAAPHSRGCGRCHLMSRRAGGELIEQARQHSDAML